MRKPNHYLKWVIRLPASFLGSLGRCVAVTSLKAPRSCQNPFNMFYVCVIGLQSLAKDRQPIGKAYSNSSAPKQYIKPLHITYYNAPYQHMNNHSYIHNNAKVKPLQEVTYIDKFQSLILLAFT